MSNRSLRLVNGKFRKKGNTPYKWYNPDKRERKLQPEDQAHLDSIKHENIKQRLFTEAQRANPVYCKIKAKPTLEMS